MQLHIYFLFYCYSDHRDLHSFPTRRSSDLHQTSDCAGIEYLRRDRPHERKTRDEENRDLEQRDLKSTRLNSSHVEISYAVFCLKKKNTKAVASSQPAPARTKYSSQERSR